MVIQTEMGCIEDLRVGVRRIYKVVIQTENGCIGGLWRVGVRHILKWRPRLKMGCIGGLYVGVKDILRSGYSDRCQ